jgi:adenylylsulfate kinase
VIAIAAAISPYRAIRDEIRERITNFFEVFVDVPLDVLIERDTKGLYKKALAGEIKGFTGIDDPYEAPLDPELVIHTDKETPAESAGRILAALRELRYI